MRPPILRSLSLTVLLVACAESHSASGDAPVPIDVDLREELAPRCPSVPTPPFEMRREGTLALASGEGAPGVTVLAADTRGERTDVLLRFDDIGTRFVLARFAGGEASTVELETLDRVSGTSGDVIARECETRVAWDVCFDPTGAGHCRQKETRRVTVPLDGSAGPLEITARVEPDGYTSARLLALEEETVVHGTETGFFLDHLTRPDEVVVVPAGLGSMGSAVASLGGGRWLAHRRDLDDLRAWIALAEGAELTTEPLAVPPLAGVSAVVGEVWVVSHERLDHDLARSRLRLGHRRGGDLSRAEPDRWLDGWGGFAPSAWVVELDGAPWVFFVTVDARYDAEVLHAARLDGLPCGRSVEEAVWAPAAELVTRYEAVLARGAPVLGAGDHVVLFARREGALELTSLRVAR